MRMVNWKRQFGRMTMRYIASTSSILGQISTDDLNFTSLHLTLSIQWLFRDIANIVQLFRLKPKTNLERAK